jgi:hypothetical protein
MSEQKHNDKQQKQIFCENPYDLETFFEALHVSSTKGMELQYIDKLVSYIRMDPTGELSALCYSALRDCKLIKME